MFSNQAHNDFVGNEHVVGKDDFEIYPKEDAELLRNDDSNVVRAGTKNRQSELYENICDSNGVRHSLFVIKNLFESSSGRRLLLGACVDQSITNSLHNSIQISNIALTHILTEDDFDKNLDFILNLVKEKTFCDRLTVAKLEDDQLKIYRTICRDNRELAKDSLDDLYKTWRIILPIIKKNVIWEESKFDQSEFAKLVPNFYAKSLSVCPIFIKDKLWGAFIAVHIKNYRVYGEIEWQIMRSISNLIARAWQKHEQDSILRKNEMEQNLILDNLSIPILLCDSKKNIVRANRAFGNYAFQVSPGFDGKNYDKFLMHLGESEDSILNIAERTKQRVQKEKHIAGKDYIRAVSPILDENGEISKYIISAIDVTDINKILYSEKILSKFMQNVFDNVDYKDSLLEMLSMLKKHLNAFNTYITWFDFDKNFKYSSCISAENNFSKHPKVDPDDPWISRLKRDKFITISDIKKDNSEFGKKYSTFGHAPVGAIYSNAIIINHQLKGALSITYENEYKMSERDMNFIKILAHLVESVFEKKISRDSLKSALKKSIQAEHAKSYFLASMSHEIRTPLNSVIGFSDIMKDDALSPDERKKYSEYISFAANSLLDLINDVLDLSKLESGNFEIIKEPCDFRAMCGDVLAIFQNKAREKNLSETLNIEQIPILYIDRRRIKQILFNLLGNALKFTKSGGIELDASFAKNTDSTGTLTFKIKDTGIGIRQEDIPNIFKPFVQAKGLRGTFAENSGTGLGLSICKQMLSKMDGEISLESEFGVGSTFTVCIKNVQFSDDIEMQTAKIIKPAAAKLPENLRVLIVDDVKMNLQVMYAIMKKLGIVAHTAQNVDEALELVKKYKFDIVLTDIWMPKINGAQLAKKIKKISAGTFVCAVSADTDTYSNFDMSSVDASITKPVTIDAVSHLVNTFFPKSRRKQSPSK